MTENLNVAPPPSSDSPQNAEALSPDFVRGVIDALDSGNETAVRHQTADLHAADLADLISLVRPDERRELIRVLGATLDPTVLTELEEGIRDEVLPLIKAENIAKAVEVLESDDAVYLLEDLDETRQREILEHVSEADRAAVEYSLQHPENSAGRLMQRQIITVPPFWTVGQTIDYMRETEDLPVEFLHVFVVDPAFHPLGTVPTSRILRTKRPVKIGDIMDPDPILIPAAMDEEDVAYQFEQYHLYSAPVVDQNSRLCGMITVDDVVGVIQETNEADILQLGGVNEEAEVTDTVLTTTRQRFSWLFVNLLTAILASIVIAFFDATIEELVALAVLMPIVASMGGNAGTQTLTIAVRALATKELTPTNTLRVIGRETMVGFLNGIVFALLLGIVGGFWFQSMDLGFVLAAAMLINLLFAGLAGILIPITLQRFGVDPAVASTVFVTTVTDVVGFFVFLGLAAWYLF